MPRRSSLQSDDAVQSYKPMNDGDVNEISDEQPRRWRWRRPRTSRSRNRNRRSGSNRNSGSDNNNSRQNSGLLKEDRNSHQSRSNPKTTNQTITNSSNSNNHHPQANANDETLKYANYSPDYQLHADEEEDVYIVQQDHGVLSILFSLVQTIILALMMWQCGIAPMKLNPMLGPYPDALSEWGGKNSPLIVEDGQWYRLFTPMLLHAGLIHLAGNVAVQLEMGVFFEKEWGSLRWLIIYIGSGVGSSILSVIFMPQAVSVGSSGAVMGLFGAKLAELVLRCMEPKHTPQQRVAHEVRREQGFAVTCSVIVVLLFSFVPYVDWAAHLGGLLAGLAIGVPIFSLQLEYCTSKTIGLVAGVALTVVGFTLALQYMYSGEVEIVEELRDVCGYYMENVQDYECNCMREEYFANLQGGGNNNNNGGGDGGNSQDNNRLFL